MCLQVYYIAEIFIELKRRAVTHSEWKAVGNYFMYPFCAFIVNIFSMLLTVGELTEPESKTLLNALFFMKNLTAGRTWLLGLQGAIDCALIGFEQTSLKISSFLLCIHEVPEQEPSPHLDHTLDAPRLNRIDSSFQ